MSDKRSLMQPILGEAEINVTTTGISISGSRLSTPRTVPFDEGGKCRSCKSTEVEVDFMITKEGVSIWCNRIKNTHFVPFDDLPGHCFFRVKNKARVFNIPYGDPNPVTCASQETHTEQQDLKRKAKVALDLVEAGLMADAMQDGSRWKKAKTAINVLGNLLLADTLPTPPKQISPPLPNDQELPPPLEPQQQADEEVEKLQEFYDTDSENLIMPKPISTLYCFGEMNPAVPALQKAGIDVYAGVPCEEIIKQMPKPLLLIFDDLMLSIDERHLSDLFTKKSHHHNFAVVFVTQNLFERKIKVARMSAQYLVLMRAPNSLLSIRNIGVQLFPRQLDFFLDAYRKATARPYGYLLIDMHAASDPMLRLRTNIFKDEQEEDEGTKFIVVSLQRQTQVTLIWMLFDTIWTKPEVNGQIHRQKMFTTANSFGVIYK
uniref:Uncharacterized protein n=1 Tax=Globodera rostochiensis TaxID=31243 RepID=A0A914HR96_GLORO